MKRATTDQDVRVNVSTGTNTRIAFVHEDTEEPLAEINAFGLPIPAPDDVVAIDEVQITGVSIDAGEIDREEGDLYRVVDRGVYFTHAEAHTAQDEDEETVSVHVNLFVLPTEEYEERFSDENTEDDGS